MELANEGQNQVRELHLVPRPPESIETYVTLLGGFSITMHGVQIEPALPPSSLTVLTYLMMYSERTHHRDSLVGVFWPDLSETVGRRRLSQTLWQIRKCAASHGAPDLVHADPTTVRIADSYTIRNDVADFEGLLDVIDSTSSMQMFGTQHDCGPTLEKALDGYTGDFLPNCYDDWSIAQRQRLHLRYRTALRERVRQLKTCGDFERALTHARQLVDSDQLDEDAHCDVMRLACLVGRPAEARHQYAQCVMHLKNELGVTPMRATTELFRQVDHVHERIPAGEDHDGPSSRSPFVGRIVERKTLLGRVDRLMAGVGGSVLIEGDGGIGKTRLLAEVAGNAQWRGARILSGGHRETDDLRPFGGLVDALAPALEGILGEQLAEVVDEHWMTATREVAAGAPATDRASAATAGGSGSSISADNRWDRCEALTQVLLAQGSIAPTIVILDDLQWCDEDTAEVITQLADRLADSRVLLVLSYRRHVARGRAKLWNALHAVASSIEPTRIYLTDLADDDARRLARWALGDVDHDPRALDELVGRSGGNPLYVIETMRAIVERGISAERPLPIGRTVAEAIARRLDGADAATLKVLETLAVAGNSLTSLQVAEIAGMARADVLESLATVIRSGYVIEHGDEFRFDHELVRRGVYTSIPAADRQAVHRCSAEVLERSGDVSVEELAEHFARGGAWDRASAHYISAARRAVSLDALNTANRHFAMAQRAHVRAGLASQALVPILLEHEHVLDVLSRRKRQSSVLKTLAAIACDEATHIEVLRRRAVLAANLGTMDEAVEIARAACARANAASILQPEAHVGLGLALFGAGRAGEALDPLEQAIRTAGEYSVKADAWCALGRAHMMLQNFAAANNALQEALAVSEAAGHRRGRVDALGSLGILAIEQGDHALAERYLRHAVELAATLGYRRGQAINLVNLATMLALTGRSGASLQPYEEALEAFLAVRDRRGEAMVLANRADIRLRLEGELETSAADARKALRYFVDIGDERHQAMCLDTLGRIESECGRIASARRSLEKADMLAKRAGDGWHEVQILRSLAMLELKAGRPHVARDAIQSSRSTAKELELHGLLPSLLVVESAVLAALGDHEASRELASDAARGLLDTSDLAPHVAAWSAELLMAAGHDVDVVRGLVQRAQHLLQRELEGLADDRRADAVSRSPLHGTIDSLSRQFIIRTTTIGLGRIGQSVGARPGDDDVVVELTISHPDDELHESKSARRQAQLLRVLDEVSAQGAVARVQDLADVLNVSRATVKRDLAGLRADGHRLVTAGSSV